MARTLRLGVIGDLHFGQLQTLFPSTWYKITCGVLEQAMEYFNTHGIKYVVFTGDIFHTSEPSQDILVKFYQYFCKHTNINMVFYNGNHDVHDANTNSLKLYSSLGELALPHCQFITKPKVLDLKGHEIVILPWPHTTIPKSPKKAKLGFAHVIVSGTQADNGRTFKSGESLSRDLFWVIGDLHKYQKSKYWCYPGALFQGNFQDDPQRYILDVFIDDNVNVNRIALQAPYKLLTKTLKKPSDFEFLSQPNTWWRIICDSDIHVPNADNILMRLPRTKLAKQLTKEISNIDAVTTNTVFTAASYLKNLGFEKPDRVRLLAKLKELK